MTYVEAIILGLIQGLTEFLPISSNAHLFIVSELAGWGDPGAAFTAVTQIGTETAVLIYFRHDIARIIRAWSRSLVDREARSDPDARLGWLVIVGTVPIAVLGYLFQDQVRNAARNLVLVAVMLIVGGLVLGLAERMATQRKRLEDMTWRDGLIYGLAQASALIPGVSRSGGTISAGLFLGYTREAATRYAFLLAIPAVLASGLFETLQIGSDRDSRWGPTIVATIVAFVVGYAVIAWLIKYVATKSYLPFVIYRLVLGTTVLALIAGGVLQPTG